MPQLPPCTTRDATERRSFELVHQVLLNCIKPTHETLFADVPNLSIENATKLSKDRKLWSSNRPSVRRQPLSGGVTIK